MARISKPIKIKRLPPTKKLIRHDNPYNLPKDLFPPNRETLLKELTTPKEYKKPFGRPAYKYDEEKTPKQAYFLVKEFGLDTYGLSKFFQVEPDTIDFWKRRHINFLRSVVIGRQAWDSLKIEGISLRERAQGYDYEEIKTEEIELDSIDDNGNKIKVPAKKITRTTKHVPPDVRAIKFWLTNRERARWKAEEKIKVESTTYKEERRVLELSIKNAPIETLEKAQALLADIKNANSENGDVSLEIKGTKVFLPDPIDVD
jgi:hypothetical protein